MLLSCNDPTTAENDGSEDSDVIGNIDPENPIILFIIADDLGKDAIAGYDERIVQPFTPILDSIKQNGLTFDNCWVYTVCSPTRALILIGRYGIRTGVQEVGDNLNADEVTLHQYLNINNSTTYNTGLVGKWHLSNGNNGIQPES